MQRLCAIERDLEEFNRTLRDRGVRETLVETRRDDGQAFEIHANSEAFAYLARIMLSLATTRSPGQHFHFDECTVLGESDEPLLIGFKFAEWDKP